MKQGTHRIAVLLLWAAFNTNCMANQSETKDERPATTAAESKIEDCFRLYTDWERKECLKKFGIFLSPVVRPNGGPVVVIVPPKPRPPQGPYMPTPPTMDLDGRDSPYSASNWRMGPPMWGAKGFGGQFHGSFRQ